MIESSMTVHRWLNIGRPTDGETLPTFSPFGFSLTGSLYPLAVICQIRSSRLGILIAAPGRRVLAPSCTLAILYAETAQNRAKMAVFGPIMRTRADYDSYVNLNPHRNLLLRPAVAPCASVGNFPAYDDCKRKTATLPRIFPVVLQHGRKAD